MFTRRQTLKTLVTGTAAMVALNLPLDVLAAARGLTWTHFQADETGFLRAPVLIEGESEAILIDGGFTLADGRALAEAIKATGKRLTTIYVSQSDPDYYFSLGPVKAAFPDARVIADAATVAAINGNVEKKLAVWGPQLKDNGPQVLADVVIPTVSSEPGLTLDGETIEIVPAGRLANRRYLWVPSLDAVFGGVLVFSGIHVWMADTPTSAERQAWIAALDEMAARNPKVVVPGHMAPGSALDASAIAYTRAYLVAFEEEAARAADSAALIKAMKARFPTAGEDFSLELSAKVVKGEMKWG
ncbi:MBL fold metallo-hydrolase [Microvirga tunisiensis]|uniref:MBL fold metallo-hydrolase n=1 Tax=Pannonibacter tanglangensis TaxID=2750084 RepID=A0A7X5J8H7_9HYPH|nr:MBL fold metallo-hydrolase [Pannonibacter sp. XCT-53]NBN78719.1 MBL fold metallo-hydrolase [Pannonibacter sp. XCT-53]